MSELADKAIYEKVCSGPPRGVSVFDLWLLTGYPQSECWAAVTRLVEAGWLYWRNPQVQRRLLAIRLPKQTKSVTEGDNDDRQDPLWR